MASPLLATYSLKTRIALAALAVFVISISSIGLFASRLLREDMQRTMAAQQFSTASIIAADINQELDDRLLALERVAARIPPIMIANPVALQAFLEERPAFQGMFNAGVAVLNSSGTAIASLPFSVGRIGINYMERDYIATALKEGRSSVSKPTIAKLLKTPVFGIAAPIRGGNGEVIGVLAGLIDLGKPSFLDRIRGNSYGMTGGYIVVAPQHKLIVTATDKSRIMQPTPDPGINPLFDRYAQGFEGSGTVLDSRGLEVLSSSKQIPVAGWLLIARSPVEEAFAPVRAMQWNMLFATIFLTLIGGSLVWWMLRRQFAPMFAAVAALTNESNSNLPPQPIPNTSQDEIGELIGGFNRLLARLSLQGDTLRESEEKYRSLVETAQELVWKCDASGRFTYLNPAWEGTHGYTVEEMLGRNFADFQRPEVFERDMVEFARHLAGGVVKEYETTHIAKNGKELTLLFNAIPQFNAKDEIVGTQGTATDITERKSTEVQVRKLSLAVEQSPESIIITNLNAEIEYVNEAFVKNTGYSRAEVIAKNPRILHSGKTPVETISALWDALTHGRSWDGEFHNRRKDGSEYIEHAVITPISQPDGTITHYVAVKEDITERRRLEEALRQHKEELQGLARSILEVREEDRRKIARELHDDLGHRVTSMSMDLGRLESKLLPSESEAKAMLPAILDQVYQFADVTRRICENLRPGMLDALGLPAAIESHIDSFAARTGIPCELAMSHDDFTVNEKVAINVFRILQEALNNAMKYAKASKILVTLQFSEQEISLIVEDNGIGLAKQAKDGRIGFGLLGMRERVATLNGQLSISSELGRGVRIEAVIPI